MSIKKPKAFSLRIDPTLFSQYEEDAKKNFRSINQQLEAVLTHAMDTKREVARALAKRKQSEQPALSGLTL